MAASGPVGFRASSSAVSGIQAGAEAFLSNGEVRPFPAGHDSSPAPQQRRIGLGTIGDGGTISRTPQPTAAEQVYGLWEDPNNVVSVYDPYVLLQGENAVFDLVESDEPGTGGFTLLEGR